MGVAGSGVRGKPVLARRQAAARTRIHVFFGEIVSFFRPRVQEGCSGAARSRFVWLVLERPRVAGGYPVVQGARDTYR